MQDRKRNQKKGAMGFERVLFIGETREILLSLSVHGEIASRSPRIYQNLLMLKSLI